MTSKAEELWEKYAIDEMVDRAPFLAALREYGAAVRQRAAGVCKERIDYAMPIPCPDEINGCLVAHSISAKRRKNSDECAAAIERMELP